MDVQRRAGAPARAHEGLPGGRLGRRVVMPLTSSVFMALCSTVVPCWQAERGYPMGRRRAAAASAFFAGLRRARPTQDRHSASAWMRQGRSCTIVQLSDTSVTAPSTRGTTHLLSRRCWVMTRCRSTSLPPLLRPLRSEFLLRHPVIFRAQLRGAGLLHRRAILPRRSPCKLRTSSKRKASLTSCTTTRKTSGAFCSGVAL